MRQRTGAYGAFLWWIEKILTIKIVVNIFMSRGIFLVHEAQAGREESCTGPMQCSLLSSFVKRGRGATHPGAPRHPSQEGKAQYSTGVPGLKTA
jgi:hypothetical protein